MASQAFLKLSKLSTPAAAQVLSQTAPAQLPHYFNALKLVKAINTNDAFHQYFPTIASLPFDTQTSVFKAILDAQFGHYIHTTALYSLASLFASKGDFQMASELILQINVNKLNPAEWQLSAIELAQWKFDVLKLSVQVSDELSQFDKFDEYLKRAHELLIYTSPNVSSVNLVEEKEHSMELYEYVDNLHSFILLRLGRFPDVFKKLYHTQSKTTLFYTLLLFNTTYISDIDFSAVSETPLGLILSRMKDGRIIYYEEYLQLLEFLLSNQPVATSLQLSLTNTQLVQGVKTVVFKHILVCVQKLYNNISLSDLRAFMLPGTISSGTSQFELSEAEFDKILYDSINSETIQAKVDDIDGLVQFERNESEWEGHIVDCCALLDEVVSGI